LSTLQKDQFVQQLTQFSLFVRNPVALGDPIPYRTSQSSRGPANFLVQVTGGSLTLDGTKILASIGNSGGMSGMGADSWNETALPSQSPGHHVLKVEEIVDLYIHPPNQNSGGTAALHWVRKLSTPFDVLSDVPADLIKLTDDPTLAGPIQASIRLGASVYYENRRMRGDFDIRNTPANVAFDIIARFDGKEYLLGALNVRSGESMLTGFDSVDELPQPPATADIILRSSERAARRTVDLNEIWKGEIVYPNVPVIVYKSK
jgi:hypothetical protein